MGMKKKHGHASNYTHSPEYRTWVAMKVRCMDSTHSSFENYGGRGIKVCPRWFNFENFLKDMGLKPRGYELDRIDIDGNYEPTNCRWITHQQNGCNRRISKRNSSGYKGVSFSKKYQKYVAYITVNYKQKHLGYFDDPRNAALVYDRAAERYHGEYACTNQSLGLLKIS